MISLTERVRIQIAAERFLPWFVPRVPVGLFGAWGPIPGVAAVEGQSEDWRTPGATRTLRLSDSSHVTETVITYDPPHAFRYRMSGFVGVMASLVSAIDGEWRCEDDRLPGSCLVTWTYRFHSRAALSPMILLLLSPAWRGYMRASLKRVRAAPVLEIGGRRAALSQS